MKQKIREMLRAGKTYTEIVSILDCARSTVGYHAKRMGLGKRRRPKYDWGEIQNYYDGGHSSRDCIRKFGFAKDSWTKAVKGGRIKARPKKGPIEKYLVEHGLGSRTHVKNRLIREGLLRNQCCKCGMFPVWNAAPLVLVLDHKNGVNDDYRIRNLRLLCPNCNSQTETFSGRNRKSPVG